MVHRMEGETEILEKQDGSLFFVHCCFDGTESTQPFADQIHASLSEARPLSQLLWIIE